MVVACLATAAGFLRFWRLQNSVVPPVSPTSPGFAITPTEHKGVNETSLTQVSALWGNPTLQRQRSARLEDDSSGALEDFVLVSARRLQTRDATFCLEGVDYLARGQG